MKIAYFDTIAGIAGDMALGAFISAGISHEQLQQELQKIELKGYHTEVLKMKRSGIEAVKFNVIVTDPPKYHKHLKVITDIIENSSLSEKVKVLSKKIFFDLAKAEAAVHNTTIEKIHFHEVGAIDSIVDIVGVAICMDILQIEKVFSSPVKLGNGGFVLTEHGKLPIPTPATVEILKDYPTVLTDIPFELTTPTGAAIIKSLSSGVIAFDKLKIKSVGYGAGTREINEAPNLLRVFIAETIFTPHEEQLMLVETNIDDMNPEIYPFVIEALFSRGAHDVHLVPIIMKKGRPGILFSVLCSKANLDEIVNEIFLQTTTLGVRITEVERRKVERGQKKIETPLGDILVKTIFKDGKESFVPEYEECKKVALEKNIPLIDVYKIINQRYV